MKLEDIEALSKIISSYKNKNGKATTIDEMLKDDINSEWIETIQKFKNQGEREGEEEGEGEEEKEEGEEEGEEEKEEGEGEEKEEGGEEKEEGEKKELNTVYNTIKKLFIEGIPEFKIFPELPIPIPPAIVLAKLASTAEGVVNDNIPVLQKIINNTIINKSLETEQKLLETKQKLNKLQQGGGIHFTKEDCTFF